MVIFDWRLEDNSHFNALHLSAAWKQCLVLFFCLDCFSLRKVFVFVSVCLSLVLLISHHLPFLTAFVNTIRKGVFAHTVDLGSLFMLAL